MPDALDNLLGSVQALNERPTASLVSITAIANDGRRVTCRALSGRWETEARLLAPRLSTLPAHTHTTPAHGTSSALAPPSRHAHTGEETETDEQPEHTHTVVHEVGDVGLLVWTDRAIPIYIGRLLA